MLHLLFHSEDKAHLASWDREHASLNHLDPQRYLPGHVTFNLNGDVTGHLALEKGFAQKVLGSE